MGISVRGQHLEHTVIDGQHSHIESTTSQIEHQNVLLTVLLVQTVGNSGGSGLVDNTLHGQTGNGSGILGGLTLSLVEVGRNSHHSVLHLLAQVRLGNLLHLGQHHSRDFLGRELLLTIVGVHLHHRLSLLVDQAERPHLLILLHLRIAELATNHTLHVEHSSLGVDGSLVLGSISNHTLLVVPSHVGRSNTVTLLVGDNFDLSLAVHSDAGIGSSQINSNHISKALLVSHRNGSESNHSNQKLSHINSSIKKF